MSRGRRRNWHPFSVHAIPFISGAYAIRIGRCSVRLNARVSGYTLLLVLAALIVGILSLKSGARAFTFDEIAQTIFTDSPRRLHLPIIEWRMPRVALALLAGASLGMAGAIFQSVSRNPLASPDIIGLSTGAATGALLVILLGTGGYYERAGAALLGGGITAAITYALACRNGVQGLRLVLVGIGISSMLASLNAWLILKADLRLAMQAAVWQVGSFNTINWQQVQHLGIIFSIAAPCALLLGRAMRQLEVGEDLARSQGLRAEYMRAALLMAGIALTAATTAVAGPIAFVALAAPQLALRFIGLSGPRLAPSAAMGALLLVFSDWAAQHLFATRLVPVGIVTICIGGAYLVWLLAGENTRGQS